MQNSFSNRLSVLSCNHIGLPYIVMVLLPFFCQASADLDMERTHPSTYINLASCYKVEGNFEAGLKCCEKALRIDPYYAQAVYMQRTLYMCINPVKIALIGLGYWTM